MDNIIEDNIKDEIFTDNYEYFFSFLTDRFEYATELWIKELEKRFNKKFKPIFVLSAKQNELFKKEDYIIINKKLKEMNGTMPNNEIVYLQDYEDLNKEFSDSKTIKELIEKLIKKQGRLFILGFTSACLEINNPGMGIIIISKRTFGNAEATES
jgi:hypothetical protein